MPENSSIREIVADRLTGPGARLFIQRDEPEDPMVSGNKLYKLKYNIKQAKEEGKRTLLTMGGAFSNHIAATARACRSAGLASIGIIRGERAQELNPTLRFAEGEGMTLEFLSRERFRHYRQQGFAELQRQFPEVHFVPEGGANALGVEGAREMYTSACADFDVICVAMGTGTTFAGLLKTIQPHQRLLGFPVLKHDRLLDEVQSFLSDEDLKKDYKICSDYHFGGYAKWNDELVAFIRDFHRQTSIELDPVYTGKMLFGVTDLLRKGRFQGQRVLCIHTGGLQGIPGFEERFGLRLFE